MKRVFFIVRTVPNLNSIPKISESSYFFTVSEEEPAETFIGELNIDEDYEPTIKELYLFELVYTAQELLNHEISYQGLFPKQFYLIFRV